MITGPCTKRYGFSSLMSEGEIEDIWSNETISWVRLHVTADINPQGLILFGSHRKHWKDTSIHICLYLWHINIYKQNFIQNKISLCLNNINQKFSLVIGKQIFVYYHPNKLKI